MIDVTCRKLQIACSLFYRWKNKFDRHGTDGLPPQLIAGWSLVIVLGKGRVRRGLGRLLYYHFIEASQLKRMLIFLQLILYLQTKDYF